MKGRKFMKDDFQKQTIKYFLMLVILTGIFFLGLNLILNYLILFSASSKILKAGSLPADYYTFSIKYLYTPPKNITLQMSFLMSFAASAYLVYKNYTAYQRKNKNKDLEGSARWMTEKELKNNKDLYYVAKNKIYAAEKSGIVLVETKNGYYIDTTTIHSLIIGTTRSGKGQTFVLPEIRMLCSGKYKQSMVLSDPKGELLTLTYSMLKDNDYNVVVLNLRDTNKSSLWNPLQLAIDEYKKTMAGNKDLSYVSKLVGEFAYIITENKKSDPIWPLSAKSLLQAMILYLLEKCYNNNCLDKLNMYSVYNFFLEYGSKNEPKEVNGALMLVNALDELFQALPRGNAAKNAYATSNFATGDMRSSIFSTLANNIEIFSDSGIAKLTSSNDINFYDLVNPERPCAIFMVIPDEDVSRHVVASLFIAQCYSKLTTIANENGGTLPLRVQFILDEFGNIITIPRMDNKQTISLSRNIILNIFLQDLNQLKTKYGDAAQTISDNCNNFIYINSISTATNEEVSKKLGNKTVEYETYSGDLDKGIKHQSTNIRGRALLTAEELSRLEFGEAIIKRQRCYPIRTKFTPFYQFGIPETQLSEIPLQHNNIDLQDIMIPFDIFEEERPPIKVMSSVARTVTPLETALSIINKITDDLFMYAYDNQDYVECQKQINYVKLNRKMTPEHVELLEDLIRHIE